MKHDREGKAPVTFKIKFPKHILWLCVAVFALCGVGIALSVWRIVKYGIHGFNDVIKYPFLIAVCLFCIVLMISLLVKSQYIVNGKDMITQYGFIKSRFAVKDITAIVYDTDSKKLTLKSGEEYAVVSVDPDWNEQLVRELRDINPNIDYSFTLSEVPKPKKK